MSKSIIDDITGEVINACKYRSMWSNPFGLVGQDLSREEEEIFEEVQPFAVDPNTGEFLNKSSVPIIVSKGKINVHERIQSFKNDVDIYTILEKFAYNDDISILNARSCQYGDISELPDNLNDYAKVVRIQFDKMKDINPELANMIIDEKFSPADIENRAIEIMNERNQAAKATDEGGK